MLTLREKNEAKREKYVYILLLSFERHAEEERNMVLSEPIANVSHLHG